MSFVDLQVARQLDLRFPTHQAEVLLLMGAGFVINLVWVLGGLWLGTEEASERVLYRMNTSRTQTRASYPVHLQAELGMVFSQDLIFSKTFELSKLLAERQEQKREGG